MAKIAIILVLAVVGCCSAISYGGLKDYAGNYYDYSTGQYSSALTGKVYNTAPVVAAPVAYAPQIAPVAYAPQVAPLAYAPQIAAASPYYYAAPYAPYAYGAGYVSPLWKK